MLALQRLQGILLPLPPVLILLMPPFDAWGKLLELLEVAKYSGRRSIQRFAELRLALVWVSLQVLED